MTTQRALLTAEELWELPDVDCRRELVRGVLKETPPAGAQKGSVALKLGSIVGSYIEVHGLGFAFGAETGFILARSPDTVRSPDFAFVSGDRLPEGLPAGFLDVTPALLAEVVLPGDPPGAVNAKAQDWLSAGVQIVWLIYPAAHLVRVLRSQELPRELRDDDLLVAGSVLPGFQVEVRALFIP